MDITDELPPHRLLLYHTWMPLYRETKLFIPLPQKDQRISESPLPSHFSPLEQTQPQTSILVLVAQLALELSKKAARALRFLVCRCRGARCC